MTSFNTTGEPSWLDKWKAKQMRDPKFVAAIEELEPWYQKIRERYDKE